MRWPLFFFLLRRNALRRTRRTFALKRNEMKRFGLVAIGAVSVAGSALAQQALHGVWVLNEGYGDALTGEVFAPVEVGHFDVATATYEAVAVVEGAAFASDLIATPMGIYVAAQGQILRYHQDTGELLASVPFDGGRRLALHEDRVYVSRGDFDQLTWEPIAFDSYLVWLDAITLEWEGSLSVEEGPQFACEGIQAVGGEVFVAVNNGFAWGNEVGRVGRFSPVTGEYVEYDLGEAGKNPVHLLERDGVLYTVNNGDWSTTSLSRVDVAEGEVLTVPVEAAAAGCNAASFVDDRLAFQVSGEWDVRTVELDGLESQGTWGATTAGFYALAEDPLSGRVYASETDWFSYGVVHVFEPDGTEAFSFDCGVSPGVLAMDIRTLNNVATPLGSEGQRVVARYDVTGRLIEPQAEFNGPVIERLEDGTSRKRWSASLPR